MIEELHIRGLGVIEEATLRLSPGLTVITGETGAGKTLVVTALDLLLGARADSSLVRRGAPMALAEAVVAPAPPEAEPWLAEGDDALIVSRELPADGRSRARLGGRLAPVSALAEVLGRHVELHAQHEHVRLARAEVQRRLVDRYAGEPHARVLATYRTAWTEWRELVARRDRLTGDARERARELDRLHAEVTEIDAAELDPEVDATLDEELERLANADELRETAAQVTTALGADGAQEPIGVAIAALRRSGFADPQLQTLLDRLDAVAAEVADLAADARHYGEQLEADPDRLAELQARRALLASLTRRFGVDVAAVLAYADEARHRAAALEDDDATAGDLDERIVEAHGAVRAAAADLHRGRVTAGTRLAADVDQHLADLAMPHARFEVAVEPVDDDALTADGGDRITFLLAANPGQDAVPIARAASGGERSRVSLAIEVALADVDDAEVLVFDEVDAGIGGATAMAVGEKLARLAREHGGRRRQVLCVTHLAQLAAFADVHHVVEKGIADGHTVTTTRQVDDDTRPAELARLLGGETAGAGLDHAKELLDQARARRTG